MREMDKLIPQVTHMLAKAARKEELKFLKKSPLEKILTKDGKISGVKLTDNKLTANI